MTQMADICDTPLYHRGLAVPGLHRRLLRRRHWRRGPRSTGLIFRAWVAAAVVTSMLGILGYFDAVPGRRDLHQVRPRRRRLPGPERLRAVPGAARHLPALPRADRQSAQDGRSTPCRCSIIVAGIFLSFSRGAWGLFGAAADHADGGALPAEQQRQVPAAHRRHDDRGPGPACGRLPRHPADSRRRRHVQPARPACAGL